MEMAVMRRGRLNFKKMTLWMISIWVLVIFGTAIHGGLAISAGSGSSTSPSLAQAWVARYDSGNLDYGFCFDLDGSGNVYVTGESFNGISSDIVTVKYNSSGTQLWASRYDSGNADYMGCPEVDASGNVYVAGSSSNGINFDIVTLKYDTNGNQLWAKRYDNGYGDERGSVVVDGSGNVYVAGSSSNGINNDIVTLKYDTNGTLLWASRYNNGYDEWATQLVLDGSGNIYVTGDSSNGINTDIVTLKYNSSGAQLWASRYDNGGWDSPGWALAVDGSGNVYVAGGSSNDFITLKYNSSGAQLWASRYDNANVDQGSDLALDASGNVYVTGDSSNGINKDIATVKYDTNGTQLWAQRYDNGGDEQHSSRNAVDASGNVYVMGGSYNGSNYDIVTVKYDTNGAQMGIARYDNGSDDFGGYRVAVDTSGNVYVTGSSSNGTNSDFVTLKYSPGVPGLTAGDQLTNISTRGSVQTGDSIMIGGFIIDGTSPKKVLIRARGPSLAAFGVAGVLSNPYLTLFSGQTVIAQNNDWQDALQCANGYTCDGATEIAATGKDPCSVTSTSCNLDSAILITLPPGSYTAWLYGVDNATGVGIVEVFDPDTSTLPKLVNISTRGKVLTGDSIMIGGFIIGAGTGSKNVLIRARGPSLAAFGVSGPIANPAIKLYSGQTVIAQNDDWQNTDPLCGSPAISCGNAQNISATGKDPCSVTSTSCNLDSAIYTTLPPGPYTIWLYGVNNATGVGVIEIFDESQ